ncbi:hypothetical protein A1OW_10360 [Enterovibrio norvegicus]|uniref:hypothetical protein n=1 Tax=Enterovibrio norvegicus TaxID=188144 RepID=UPI0003730D0E|nr:hypothetical protein [Enterovibrio norvegicus]OEF50995.1 hypothetical protein A1OW_10360 [Enterovibrio norvegicus]
MAKYFDDIMDMWARWVQGGQLVSGYRSLTSVMIENKGVMSFGSGGGRGPCDGIEARIEASLMVLAQTNAPAVEAIRIEYAAKHLPGLPLDAPQADKAMRLGVSLRTYRYRLKAGRTHVMETLEGKKRAKNQ